MTYPNPLGLPEEILGIVRSSKTAEYASVTKAGVPITSPIGPFVSDDGGTLDVQTGLAYAAKAQRARNHPKVGLLYSEPLGCGLEAPPVVLVRGEATVRDADLQANTDRYVRTSRELYPEAYGRFPAFFLKTMWWYFARIWIEVTPISVLWWPGGDLSAEPRTWEAPEGTRAPPSDPPPTGRGLRNWDEPPTEWRGTAEHAVKSLGRPVLTTVDVHGYPVPIRARHASLEESGFRLELWPTMPTPTPGKACLLFHTHDAKFTWNENVAFVGELKVDELTATLDVERRLNSVSFEKTSQLRTMLFMWGLRRKMAPRLKLEAARRGQTVPKIRVT